MKKTQMGTQAQREGSKQRFHVLPRRRRFPKSCKTKAAGLQLFMRACDFSFFLFSFSPAPVSRAHKEQLGSTREQPTQWFLFKGHFPSKKKKGNGAPCGVGGGNEFATRTQNLQHTCIGTAAPESFSCQPTSHFQKKCKSLFSSTLRDTPDVRRHFFPHLLLSIFVLLQSSGYFLHHLMFIYLFMRIFKHINVFLLCLFLLLLQHRRLPAAKHWARSGATVIKTAAEI